MKRFEKLTAFIDALEKADFSNSVSAEEKMKNTELKNDLRREAVYVATHTKGFPYKDYSKIINSWGIKWEYDSMMNADVSMMNSEGLLALLTAAFRADHFCDGAFDGFVESGAVTVWLKQLKKIDDEGEPEELVIKPVSVIDTKSILSKWAEDWNETDDNNTEKY